MNLSHLHPKAIRALELPPAEFRAYVEKLDSEDRRLVARDLEAVAYFAAVKAEYVTYRFGFGCGDQGHKAADRRAQRAARKVWGEVFGYNSNFAAQRFPFIP